jgi:hypothetical protein
MTTRIMGHGETSESELEAVWQRAVACATAYDDSAPLESALEAGALGVVLEATGALTRVPERERRTVRDAARRALLRAAPGAQAEDDDDADDADALRLAATLAREGVRALAGKPRAAEGARASVDAWHPPASALVAMKRGAPDGFAAASVALHVARCAACAAALRLSSGRADAALELRAAASTAAPMLAPHEGRVVATRDAPAAEAIAFTDALGELVAIYTSEALPVRYVAEGLTPLDMRPGYWSGRCASGARRFDGTLHVGETVIGWVLDLTH